MKSTVKIDYVSNQPCIKVVQRFDTTDVDDDVRDILIKQFLHTPGEVNPNDIFILSNSSPLEDFGKWVTITPVPNELRFLFFRNSIVNTLKSYGVIFDEAKIDSLFSEIEWAIKGNKVGDKQKTLRYVYEMLLTDEARMKAFNNTPKEKLDLPINTVYEGIEGAFIWDKTPEGNSYWKDIAMSADFESIQR